MKKVVLPLQRCRKKMPIVSILQPQRAPDHESQLFPSESQLLEFSMPRWQPSEVLGKSHFGNDDFLFVIH